MYLELYIYINVNHNSILNFGVYPKNKKVKEKLKQFFKKRSLWDDKLEKIWMKNFSISINIDLMYLELYIYINVN